VKLVRFLHHGGTETRRHLTENRRGRIAMLHEERTDQIIGAAIEVHRYWGPGLYEEIYQRSLCQEFRFRGIPFDDNHRLPLLYKGVKVGDDRRPDIIVGKEVVVELKAVAQLLPIHEAQLLAYLKLSGYRVGLLVNFNVPVLKDGILRRVV
jgi:GxxExxY protein